MVGSCSPKASIRVRLSAALPTFYRKVTYMKCGNEYCRKETDRLYVLRGPDRAWDFCFDCYISVVSLINRFTSVSR
jgi:hypothetical protein